MISVILQAPPIENLIEAAGILWSSSDRTPVNAFLAHEGFTSGTAQALTFTQGEDWFPVSDGAHAGGYRVTFLNLVEAVEFALRFHAILYEPHGEYDVLAGGC